MARKKKPAAEQSGDAQGEGAQTAVLEAPTPRMQTLYEDKIRQALKERFGYKNDFAVPRLVKIVISMGVGKALVNPKRLEEAQKHLTLIAGQKAVITRAKRSVSNFRLREGQAIGCKVTLRRARMYEFLDRLISIAIPRIRDFRGLTPIGWSSRRG